MLRVCVCFVGGATNPLLQVGGLLFGYDIGVSGGAIVSLTAADSSTDWGSVGWGWLPWLPNRIVQTRAVLHSSIAPSLMADGIPLRSGLTPLLVGAVVSSSLMGALAGSIAILLQGDKLGRRQELLGAAGLYGRKCRIT